jgi:signal transduction histidine kinase
MDRIARIVRQLLDAGRVAGRLEHREVVNLSRAITNAITASAPSRTDDVVVAVSVSEEVRILGSTSLVEQVLVNLLANAAQAILERRSAGRIEVSASLVDARVIVKVKDDGPGISEEAQLRLFEPFFTTKPQGKGTGLGLAVSLGLMRTLGGELAVDTTSPQGTTMSFALPVAPERS